MNDKDRERFGKIMAGLQVGLGKRSNKKLSLEELRYYFDTLKDLDVDTIEKAANDLINTKRIREFPTPGEIRETAGLSQERKALIAWYTAIEAARLYSHSSVQFDDPVIHTAILKNWGSWDNFTTLELWGKDSRWLQRMFIQAYLAYSSDTNHPKYLPGFFSDCINFNPEHDIVQIKSDDFIKQLPEAKDEEPF